MKTWDTFSNNIKEHQKLDEGGYMDIQAGGQRITKNYSSSPSDYSNVSVQNIPSTPSNQVGPKIVGPKKVGPAIVGPKLVGPKIVGTGNPITDWIKNQTSPKPAAPTPAPTAQQTQQSKYGNIGSLGNTGGNLKFIADRTKERNAALQQQMKDGGMLKQSYELEGEVIESHVPGKPAEKLKTERNMYSISAIERAAAAERIKAKTAAAKAKREKQREDSEIKEEKKGMSKDEMLSVLKGHQYTKPQLLDMSKKSTKEGRHGEAAAFYHEFQKEEHVSEMAVSRAQQRFFGMVRAEQEGKMKGASPAVKKAAKSMTAQQAHDFAATKHAGLPEKKVETKEELSLVQKILEEILNEAPKGTIPGGISKARKYKAFARQAKLAAAVNRVMKDDSDQEQKDTPTTPTKNPKEPKKTSAYVKYLNRRLNYQKRKDIEQKKKEILSKQQDDIEKRKQSIQKLTQKQPNFQMVTHDEPAGSAAQKVAHNLGQVAAGIGRAAVAGVKIAKLNQKEKEYEKQKQNQQSQSQPKPQSESFYNWRESFIFEVDDSITNKTDQQRIVDVLPPRKKNKIIIDPKIQEAVLGRYKEDQGGGKTLRPASERMKSVKKPQDVKPESSKVTVLKPRGPRKGEATASQVQGWRGSDRTNTNRSGQATPHAKSIKEEKKKDETLKKEILRKVIQAVSDEKKRKNYLLTIGNIGTVEESKTPAWQRKEGKNPTGGLNKKGIASYRREHPGSHLSLAVTEKPSKLKKGSKKWKRRKSFCARMSGMPGPMKDEKGRPTRKALSLRKWNC